jgi:hypothetical protein
MSQGSIDHPACHGSTWKIELMGSEISRVEQRDSGLVVVLSAARVSGDRSQLDPVLSGGHLQGVCWHLFDASWAGDPSALMGRIDEAQWQAAPSPATHGGTSLNAPSSGTTHVQLTLTTALGDTLVVQAQAWRVELVEGGRFTPSLAC